MDFDGNDKSLRLAKRPPDSDAVLRSSVPPSAVPVVWPCNLLAFGGTEGADSGVALQDGTRFQSF